MRPGGGGGEFSVDSLRPDFTVRLWFARMAELADATDSKSVAL